MKKEYKIEGMSCNHCRKTVENALNDIQGAKAEVSLDPAVAKIEFKNGEKTIQELQEVLTEAGEYKITAL